MKHKSLADEILERSRRDSGLPEEAFGQDPYDMFCVPMEIYNKYKDEVIDLGLACQKWVAPEDGGVLLEPTGQFCDREISEQVGLDEDSVTRIRCMSEWDMPIEVWRNAATFKMHRRRVMPLGSPDREIKDEPC